MARRNDGEQAGERMAQPPMRLDQHRLLAGMGRRSDDNRALADRRLQRRQGLGIGGRLRHVELEVPRGPDPWRAEIAEAPGMGSRLRGAGIEAAQERADGSGHAPPAIERTTRDY